MNWLRVMFLVGVLVSTSGYRWRCYMACVDQTSIQNDYIEQRDHCRELAQLKVDMAAREAGGELDDRNHKATLVSVFSQCMAKNGWTVPDGKGEGATKKADVTTAVALPAAAVAAPSAAMIATTKQEDKALLTRASECSFARYSAAVSSNAATRAQACDLECAEALRLSPGAPRPASCPADLNTKLAKGHEQ